MRQRPLYMEQIQLDRAYRNLPNPRVEEALGVPYPKEALQRHVGIEIEVEKCGETAFRVTKWNVEKDGSLRGHDAYEFKTFFPSTCQDGLDALAEFFGMVARKRAKGEGEFDFSERTSIHIHVDVRDLSTKEILSLTKLYAIFEKSFFDLVGRDRRHNIFCIPLSESALIGDAKKGNFWWGKWEKYCAINLAPLITFGTVEFRGMAGNDNQALIRCWLLMLVSLAEFAAHHSPEEINAMIDTLKVESQYQQLANDIFGYELASLLTMFPEASDSAASLTKLL
jgi:Putative amidoligase enzyme